MSQRSRLIVVQPVDGRHELEGGSIGRLALDQFIDELDGEVFLTMFIFANEDFDMLDKVDLNLIVEPNGHKSTDTSMSCSKFEDSKHTEEPKTNSDTMANKAPKENLAANLVITNDQSASDAPKDNLDANSKATSSNSASDSASVALNQVLLSR